ncbi:MAG: substrate-binding domain-containing protein [Treponema sp.]|nr:substrate-binding domain-containing protein [Treponema sp.]
MRIGLVLSVLDEEYQISVYEGIKKKADEFGFELVCFQVENVEFNTDAVISRITDKELFGVDFIILLASVLSDSFLVKSLSDVHRIWGNVPVVSIGQEIKELPSLLVRSESSMHSLIEHMIVFHGYRHFLYISGTASHQDAVIREKYFLDCMRAYKEKYRDLSYTIKNALFTEISAIEAMKSFFEENTDADVDAVMCANDNMAIGVYKFLKMNRENLKAKDVAVTGFDDIPQSRFSNPSITTVSQSVRLLGEMAVDVVKKMQEGCDVEKKFYVGSEVILRESCGCSLSRSAEEEKKFFNQLQKMYIRSETMLRLVTRLGQNLNFAQNPEGLRYVLNDVTAEFEASDFILFKFEKRDVGEILVEPEFVYRGHSNLSQKFIGKTYTLGDFYSLVNNGQSLIFKYLYSGDEIVGGLLYNVPLKVLPYINSVSINIAQALVRIQVQQARQRYAEQLERDVALRTEQVIEAEHRRLAVEAQVLKISEMERQRFSNDLHDDICQRLAGISMLCRSYSVREKSVSKEEMSELSQLIGETLQTTRQYAHNSYPVELERLGLNKAIGNLCNSFEKQSGIRCIYLWKIKEGITFSEIQALNVFRIIQESLHNIMKHSGAGEACVSLESDVNNSRICVTVTDDGKGLSGGLQKRGLGLDSMQYRANQIDALFSFAPLMPHGTEIKLEFEVMGKV